MQEYHDIGFAKTASKKVLGSMNQIAFEWEVRVQMKEGPDNIRVLEMNKEMNRISALTRQGRSIFILSRELLN